MKVCGKCQDGKELTEFAKSAAKGHQSYCKDCSRRHKREWIVNNRDVTARNRLWSRYRLRPADYEAMLLKQNNSCGICERNFTETPCVDHDHLCCKADHSCGKCIRGLLCQRCNKLLGGYEEMLTQTKLSTYLLK